MSFAQEIANWVLGSYRVATSQLNDGSLAQHVVITKPNGQTIDQFGAEIYTIRIDEASSTVTYLGEAAVGALPGDPLWRIKRINSASGTQIEYAGASQFNQVWNNRAALPYA